MLFLLIKQLLLFVEKIEIFHWSPMTQNPSKFDMPSWWPYSGWKGQLHGNHFRLILIINSDWFWISSLVGLTDSIGWTHGMLGDLAVILRVWFSNTLYRIVAWALTLWHWSQMIASKHHYWEVNTGSGDGLVQSANEPLPDTMLSMI